jgi:predicted RNA binding protein YcfA (HicA-like mRNA interferase family)
MPLATRDNISDEGLGGVKSEGSSGDRAQPVVETFNDPAREPLLHISRTYRQSSCRACWSLASPDLCRHHASANQRLHRTRARSCHLYFHVLRVTRAGEPQARYAAESTRGILGRVKVREVLRRLEDDGWYHVRTVGSHRQFRHASKPGTVTVAGKESLDVPPGTLNSIFKQAGLKK